MLNTYLRELNIGFPKDLAFERAFGMSYKELDKEVKTYLRRGMQMRVFSAASGGLSFPQVTPVITQLNQADLYAELPYLLLNFSALNKVDRKQLLKRALELNPKNLNLKAFALGQPLTDNRQQLLAEIEKVAPNNAMLLTVKGDDLYWRAELLRLAGDPTWQDTMKQARGFYRRAISANPQLPKPYWGLGKAYDFLPPSEPLKEGAVGYENTVFYERSPRIFANYADMFIRMDKPMEALPILRNTIAFSLDEPDERYMLVLNNLELMQTLLAVEPPKKSDAALLYTNGCIYEGAIKNNKPDGNGKLSHPSGSYYQGQFSGGLMQGEGKLVSDQGVSYQGEFKQGVMKGRGRIDYRPQDGFVARYEGEVYYGFPQGKGSFTTKAGTYTGDFWYSWRHGQGEYSSADGKVKVKGAWNYSQFVWPEESGEVFIGGFNALGQRHSHGVCREQKTPFTLMWCRYQNGKRIADKAINH